MNIVFSLLGWALLPSAEAACLRAECSGTSRAVGAFEVRVTCGGLVTAEEPTGFSVGKIYGRYPARQTIETAPTYTETYRSGADGGLKLEIFGTERREDGSLYNPARIWVGKRKEASALSCQIRPSLD